LRVAHAVAWAAVVLLAAAPASPQAPDPVSLDPVVVSVTRLEQRASEAPASVTVLTRPDVETTASQTVDDLLRQVPGFSLFRRSSSLVANPTTQGVSLRGIGPSGTSRALVLLDGVPINDPFGGWVYWNRVPLAAVDQIEVVRGGGSSVWGNYALGGIVHILTRRPTERGAWFDASYGNHNTANVDLRLTEAWGPLRIGLEGNWFTTDGYEVVKASRRGSIDVNADAEHALFNGRLEFVLSPDLTLFVAGNYYDEERGNGTPLQFNRTDSGLFATGLRARTERFGEWAAAVYGQFQEFRSTFSTQALDRNSETLALDQLVPSTSWGGSLQWSQKFGDHLVSAGGDARWIDGETKEKVFANNVFVRTRVAGGQQIVAGIFLQDVWVPVRVVEVTGGIRADYWTNYDAFRRDTPPPAGVPAQQSFSDIERLILSPRAAGLFHLTATTDLRASAYQGFRVPTLNELYRVFRVRNDVTVANANLKPERVTGGELGLSQRWGPLEARVTGYWNDVKDLVANVTLAAPLPDCPAGTTCRQRQNLDLARVRGVETELEWRVARDWRVFGSYLYVDARVVDAPNQPGLEGKRLAQVPTNAASAGLRYANPAILNASLVARYVGQQYEDDLNTLPLGSYVVFDAFLSRAFARWGEAYFAVENLFDRTYTVGRTSEGVISIGAPRLVRGGVRLAF
jgi:outer membrane cobalamin receptor